MPETSACSVCLSTLWKQVVRSARAVPFGWLTCAAVILGPGGSLAAISPEISGLCDQAARRASKERGVPYDVLRAISRAETGRVSETVLQPWPWTVNMEGAGKWFQTEDDARAYVFTHFKRGARSFDVGCFQINYKWHGSAFRSIDDMFDPMLNAHYAAGFLAELYEEYGDWSAAAGAYHSRTPTFAEPYAKRFERIRNTIASDSSPNNGRVAKNGGSDGTNDAGLFAARATIPPMDQGSGRLGSLVPLIGRSQSASRAFIAIN